MLMALLPGLVVIGVLQIRAPGSLAQTGRGAVAVVSNVDSARIVRDARSAQSSFELFRRNRLPLGERYGGPCDVRIGRYCYWRGNDDDDDDNPPEEPASIRERRDQLIRLLDNATAVISGDPWLAGQHVRYLVEAGRTGDAVRYAGTACRAAPSWCSALAGYAAHVGGQFQIADSAFNVALAAMDTAERCRWLDASDLLDDDVAREFKSVGCAGREAFVRRLFWLGAPLYSVSATDLLTEHFARFTRARIAEHAATPDGEPWADDERELMVRYGWPRWYSRTEPPFGSELRPSVTGHDSGKPYDFLPNVHAITHVGHVASDDWNLDDARAPTGYAPTYARSVHTVPHQIATFRRGDSTLVVAAWDARRDTTLIGRPLEASLVLANDAQSHALTIERMHDVRAIGHIAATGVIDSGLVSLELLATSDRRAGRARLGLAERSSGRLALSDLLLYAPSSIPPYDLEAVLDSALASDIVPASRAVGVYWEMYGLEARGEPVQFTLSVQQVAIGWMQRAAETLHLSDPSTGLRIQWDEVPQQASGIAGRGVRVDLSRLRSGHYHVELSALARGASAIVTSKEIEVR
jgi:hypothetical protein